LEGVLASELSSRKFSYTRSDGSAWTLALKDVADRAVDLEMAYTVRNSSRPSSCISRLVQRAAASSQRAPPRTIDSYWLTRTPSAQSSRWMTQTYVHTSGPRRPIDAGPLSGATISRRAISGGAHDGGGPAIGLAKPERHHVEEGRSDCR
jgi:hypothetical protein